MSRVYARSEKVVNASPDSIYEVLSDYKGKHRQILPPNFQEYSVEKGGKGSGTIVNYRLHAARRERPYRISIDEPVKGQVITERDTNSSLVTTWILAPINDGQQTRVSVATEWEGSKGFGGFFEKIFAPLGLRSIYKNMLSLLTEQVLKDGTITAESEDEASSIGSNVLLFFVIFGGVVGIAYLLYYLRRQRA